MKGVLYIPGASFLHRVSPLVKILSLLAFGIVILFIEDWRFHAVNGIFTFGLLFVSGLGLKQIWQRLYVILFAILFVFVANLYLGSLGVALTGLFRVSALVFLATAITAATPVGDFLAGIKIILTPLERVKLANAAAVGLAVSLVLRFVPEITLRYAEIYDAQRARGIKPKLIRTLIPLIVHTLRTADEISLAVEARGFSASPSGENARWHIKGD